VSSLLHEIAAGRPEEVAGWLLREVGRDGANLMVRVVRDAEIDELADRLDRIRVEVLRFRSSPPPLPALSDRQRERVLEALSLMESAQNVIAELDDPQSDLPDRSSQ